MENKPLRNLYLMVGGVLLLLCLCFVILSSLFRNKENVKPGQKQLSCVVIGQTDLPAETNFKLRGQTGSCNQYLNLNGSEVAQRCYQVMFSTDDKSILLLNAIWEYPDASDQVQSAYSDLIAQKPENSFDLVLGLPTGVSIGEESNRSQLSLQRPSGVAGLLGAIPIIYADSIYWRFNKWLLRITSLDTQGPNRVDLISLAQRIQLRLEAVNNCMSE